MATLHYTSGGSGTDIAKAGFNLASVQYVDQVNELPEGMKGLVYLDEANGVTQSFIDKVTPFLGNPNVFGFFLVDEPDPTGQWGTYASAANLKAESDWIHEHFPGAKTYITMMSLGTSANPDFRGTYNPANTGIDYYGVDVYPVRTDGPVDYNMIDKFVAAAQASGIPTSQIVPGYQAFGGGEYNTDMGGKYVVPTAAQMETMMEHWAKLVPSPAFDYAYAWGSQRGDTALESSSELQAVFRQHNLATTGTEPPPVDTSDTLYGTSGDDVFHGAGGHTMIGYGGNDIYYVDDVRDKEVETAGGGTDKALASVSHVLAAGSEIELLATSNASGTTAINLTGNEFGQAIQGNAGANVINGLGGADKMSGYGGDDTYYVDNAGDRVIEAAGGGTDRVFAAVSHTLSAGSQIELLATSNASGTTTMTLNGNEFGQTIQGNAGANVINGLGGSDMMSGYGGNDTYYVDNAGDRVIEAVGGGSDSVITSVSHALSTGSQVELLAARYPSDTTAMNLSGNEFSQTILGNAGANVINGGRGADMMSGYGGNDTYYVDNAGDKVNEAVGGGSDSVITSVSHAFSTGSQIELLATSNASGTTAINLTGNEFGQAIQGNAGANVINGLGGADKMSGYGGDDTYYVDNAGDRVIEAAGGGTDRVFAAVSHTLSAGSQIELLATSNASGTTTMTLNGNEFGQTIQGNAGANVINGLGGSDMMSGYGGNDTYYVDNAGDRVIEAVGGGSDKVLASVSHALLAGSQIELLATTNPSSTSAINLTGNAFAQTIQGNAGANVINGGGGADILTGNGGNDAFVFNSALGAGNIDKVTDFNKLQDKIQLDDAVFAGLKLGGLSSDAFFAGTAAHDSSDHIIYNSSTGALSFDSDGIGGAAQIQFATLSPGLSLTAGSFLVI
ncbi:calcium-binding protein [Mesorhizobium sp. M1169]|uniref:beta strand repeat-containing protein n=1 Tax=Mesorhizobium sp. M1169 TaxID=2957066 RepID=UPI00333A80CC